MSNNTLAINSFSILPKFLIENEQYSFISNEAKLLYAMLLDRHRLSESNGDKWKDDNGVFIIFSRQEIAKQLNKCIRKVYDFVAELKNTGLIKESRKGLGRPNLIYVQAPKHTKKTAPKAVIKPEKIKEKNIINSPSVSEKACRSRPAYHADPDRHNLPTNNTEVNNTNINNTIYLSKKKKTTLNHLKTKIKRWIDNKIQYNYFSVNKQTQSKVDSIVNLMLETYLSSQTHVNIAKQLMPIASIKRKLTKINRECVEYIINCIDNNSKPILNMRSYLLTCLFNAPDTVSYYSAYKDKPLDIKQPAKHKHDFEERTYTNEQLDSLFE